MQVKGKPGIISKSRAEDTQGLIVTLKNQSQEQSQKWRLTYEHLQPRPLLKNYWPRNENLIIQIQLTEIILVSLSCKQRSFLKT